MKFGAGKGHYFEVSSFVCVNVTNHLKFGTG